MIEPRKTTLQILIIFSIKYCESGKWKVERPMGPFNWIFLFLFNCGLNEFDLIFGDERILEQGK